MKKILVIEDDINILESLIDLLELKNYDVISAKDGNEGYQKAMSESPDIIICDVMMPGMNGYNVLEKLNSNNKKRIPFIFLSALSTKDDVRAGMTGGAADYLIKPFRAQELFNTIDRNLNQ